MKRDIRSRIVSEQEVEQLRWQHALREVAEELPELIARRDRCLVAARESTVSGALRRACFVSPMDMEELANRAGISQEEYLDFLEGARAVPSDVIDRLATLLGCELLSVADHPADFQVLPTTQGR